MLSGFRSLWERLSSIGASGETGGELRRIHLTNQSAAIGVVSCGSYAIAYALGGAPFRAAMVANIAGVAMFLAALALNHRGARTSSKLAILIPVNLVDLVACMVVGDRVGFLYYFFLFAVVALLLFSEDEPFFRWSLAAFSTGCCIFVRFFAPLDSGLLTARTAHVLDVLAALAVFGTSVIVVHLFTGDTALAERRLAKEHARSERLLLNILPGAISMRLKDDDQAIADGFAEVTVLFADLVGFTELSQKLSPEELVEMLNRIFSAFDILAEHLGIEKIKTIGDCYMVAAGLPEERPDHAEAAARMALGMRDALDRINETFGYLLCLRIGLHTGPVVAGVIGKSKFIYDLWGDTVNTASRMESSGSPREIQVTKQVAERLGDKFLLEPRGVIHVKGKGDMETYWLRGEQEPDQGVITATA